MTCSGGWTVDHIYWRWLSGWLGGLVVLLAAALIYLKVKQDRVEVPLLLAVAR
jgi:hypothetical protein